MDETYKAAFLKEIRGMSDKRLLGRFICMYTGAFADTLNIWKRKEMAKELDDRLPRSFRGFVD